MMNFQNQPGGYIRNPWTNYHDNLRSQQITASSIRRMQEALANPRTANNITRSALAAFTESLQRLREFGRGLKPPEQPTTPSTYTPISMVTTSRPRITSQKRGGGGASLFAVGKRFEDFNAWKAKMDAERDYQFALRDYENKARNIAQTQFGTGRYGQQTIPLEALSAYGLGSAPTAPQQPVGLKKDRGYMSDKMYGIGGR